MGLEHHLECRGSLAFHAILGPELRHRSIGIKLSQFRRQKRLGIRGDVDQLDGLEAVDGFLDLLGHDLEGFLFLAHQHKVYRAIKGLGTLRRCARA